MNKVISLKGLRLKSRRSIVSKPKRNVDVKPDVSTGNIYRIALSFACISSVLLGALFYSKMAPAWIEQYIINAIKELQSTNFAGIFKYLCSMEIIFVVTCFIFGTNLFGNILISVVPIIKTFFAGFLGALMYNKYELNGVLFSLIFFVPYFSVTSSALIALTKEGFTMSRNLTHCILQRKTTKDGDLQLFLIRFLLITLFDLLFVLLNSLLLSSFGAKISLQ